mmetsp:Transcript_12686/g.30858  ORF Transcript_12686/g.30858 Transcript_12686/m.30858 type:complete len:268 (+) Transcript_12686:175-978(+)
MDTSCLCKPGVTLRFRFIFAVAPFECSGVSDSVASDGSVEVDVDVEASSSSTFIFDPNTVARAHSLQPPSADVRFCQTLFATQSSIPGPKHRAVASCSVTETDSESFRVSCQSNGYWSVGTLASTDLCTRPRKSSSPSEVVATGSGLFAVLDQDPSNRPLPVATLTVVAASGRWVACMINFRRPPPTAGTRCAVENRAIVVRCSLYRCTPCWNVEYVMILHSRSGARRRELKGERRGGLQPAFSRKFQLLVLPHHLLHRLLQCWERR